MLATDEGYVVYQHGVTQKDGSQVTLKTVTPKDAPPYVVVMDPFEALVEHAKLEDLDSEVAKVAKDPIEAARRIRDADAREDKLTGNVKHFADLAEGRRRENLKMRRDRDDADETALQAEESRDRAQVAHRAIVKMHDSRLDQLERQSQTIHTQQIEINFLRRFNDQIHRQLLMLRCAQLLRDLRDGGLQTSLDFNQED